MSEFDPLQIKQDWRDKTILRDPETGTLSTYRVEGAQSAEDALLNSTGEIRWDIPTRATMTIEGGVIDSTQVEPVILEPKDLERPQHTEADPAQTPVPGRHRLEGFDFRRSRALAIGASLGSTALGAALIYFQRQHLPEVWEKISDFTSQLLP